MLRGLGDPLQTAIARQGLRVRTYCPVGDLVAGMAYLVRRLLENTSNESFLHEQARGAALDELLAKPVASAPASLSGLPPDEDPAAVHALEPELGDRLGQRLGDDRTTPGAG